jgi:hypothetical protein
LKNKIHPIPKGTGFLLMAMIKKGVLANPFGISIASINPNYLLPFGFNGGIPPAGLLCGNLG